MSWRKGFARNVRFSELKALGPFKIEDAPEALGKGKFRAVLVLKKGGKAMLSTYEGTIGDIAAFGDVWVEAYEVGVGKETYVRFREAE